jgi:hypothetical protein
MLISGQYNDWNIPVLDVFAVSYMDTLRRSPPSSVECCARCSALLHNTAQAPHTVNPVCATVQDCPVCILLRQACRDRRSQDYADIDIVRRGAILEDRVTGERLLRLCRDTGPSSTLCSLVTLDAYACI